jgi:plastocyanin
LTLAIGVAAAIPARAETITVTIDKLVFSPVDIQAKVGDTVEWVNNDILAHTATVKGDWDVMIPPKKSAKLTLKKPGTVEYFCRFHPNMKGHVTVSP